MMQCSGALVVTGGLVILCVIDCVRSNLLLVCVTVATGCQGLQYLAVMSMPLELSRRNAPVVGALSSLIANVVKFAASFAVHHVAHSVGLSLCFRHFFRQVLKFNHWEYVKCFMHRLGRLDLIHVLALRKLQWPIFIAVLT